LVKEIAMERIEISVPASAISAFPQHLFWIKKCGDKVADGESIASVEAEKGLHFITSPSTGILDEIVVAKGQIVKSGQVIGFVRKD
jgi:biotin carboxyl carrier protein